MNSNNICIYQPILPCKQSNCQQMYSNDKMLQTSSNKHKKHGIQLEEKMLFKLQTLKSFNIHKEQF